MWSIFCVSCTTSYLISIFRRGQLPSSSPWLSCYHDARSNRVFLHFVNQFTDASELLRRWESARAELESSSREGSYMSNVDAVHAENLSYAKLIAMFGATHFVVNTKVFFNILLYTMTAF